MGEVRKRFGVIGGCKVRIDDDGYLEVTGAPLNDRVRVPLRSVRTAVARREQARAYGGRSEQRPVVVLVGEGVELGRAVLSAGQLRMAEQCAKWINEYLAATGARRGRG
jgi:hypothetical protein